jgi:uncharacterized membrane protein YeaQ/YmgE (transglycosylase-associated protein family)
MLTLVLWVVVGAIAGIVARAIAPPPPKKRKQVQAPITILAILGAVVAGMMCDVVVRANSIDLGTDYASVLAACLGAAVIVVVARALAAHVDR